MSESTSAHVPERKCVGCGRLRPRTDLVRVTVRPDVGWVVDVCMTMGGRGAYLCRDRECLKRAVSRGSMARSLRASLGPQTAALAERLQQAIS